MSRSKSTARLTGHAYGSLSRSGRTAIESSAATKRRRRHQEPDTHSKPTRNQKHPETTSGTRHPLPEHPEPDTHSLKNTRNQTPGTRHPLPEPGTRHPLPEHPEPDTPGPDTHSLNEPTRKQTPGSRHPPEAVTTLSPPGSRHAL